MFIDISKHVFIVDKIFIETAVLLLLASYNEKGFGIDYLIEMTRKSNGTKQPGSAAEVPYSDSRRDVLKNLATLPFPGVMGHKVLAAGAIEPKDGFEWAFENGADFICVGMFDFQIVKDVNICLDILNGQPVRQREWYG
jgi:hypothetical protein